MRSMRFPKTMGLASRGQFLLLASAIVVFAAQCAASDGSDQQVAHQKFSRTLQDWWVEGGRSVEVTQGHLLIDADPPDGKAGSACTVWFRRPLPPGDVRIEYDAHVVSSAIGADNINVLLCYSDPLGRPLPQSRHDRADGAYKKYHGMNGYIITFLRDRDFEGGKAPDGSAKARVRIRRCPGFELLAETYAGRCEAGQTYSIRITKRGGQIEFAVDGKMLLETIDPHPHEGGYIGLRTWRTKLWWDNVKLTMLEGPYRRPTIPWPTLIQNSLEVPEPDGRRPVFVNPPTFRWPTGGAAEPPFTVWLAGKPDFSDARELGTVGASFLRPLQPLAARRYYWKVTDKRGTTLLPTASFELGDDVHRWPLEPWDKAFANVPAARPRLFLRPEWLPRLRGLAAGEFAPLVEFWKHDASRAMRAKLPDPATFQQRAEPDASGHRIPAHTAAKYFAGKLTDAVPNLCILYLLTEDASYGKEVRRRVEAMLALDSDGFTSHRRADFANGRIVYALAWAYDAMHDRWSDAERQRIREVLLKRAGNTFRAYKPRFEQKLFAPHGWQHVLQNVTTGALALYHESEEARQWFQWSAKMHVALYPWFGGPDGGSNEGINYYLNTNMLSSIYAAALFDAATDGLVDLFDGPWYHGTPYYLLYSAGLGKNRSQFGDRQWPFASPVDLRAAIATRIWAGRLNDPYIAAYHEAIGRNLDHTPLSQGGGPMGLCLLAWHPLKMPSPNPLADLEKARLFRGIGVVAMRSDLNHPDNEIFFEMRASPYGSYGHSHGDQNSLNVMAFGEPLIVDAGYYHSYGDEHHRGYTVTAAAHNTILIGDQGQGSRAVPAYGRIVDFQIGDGFVRVVGDAARAYQDVAVRRFDRHVLWLQPDTLLIVDDLETVQPQTFQWLLHSVEPMKIDKQVVHLRVGEAAGRLEILQPAGLRLEQTDKFPVPVKVWRADKQKKTFPPQWHLTASTTQPSARQRFVSVLQIHRVGPESTLPQPIVEADDNGVSIRLPDGRAGRIKYRSEL